MKLQTSDYIVVALITLQAVLQYVQTNIADLGIPKGWAIVIGAAAIGITVLVNQIKALGQKQPDPA